VNVPAYGVCLLPQVDPELVDSHFLRPHDHTIRATDLPERLQLLGKPILEVRGVTGRQALGCPCCLRHHQHAIEADQEY